MKLTAIACSIYLLFETKMTKFHSGKFFEFIQPRLAAAIGPSSVMAELVYQYNCGIVSADFNPRTLVGSLHGLDEDKSSA